MQRRLMIADDNENISRLVARVAERNGWTCSIHSHGADLIKAVGTLNQNALIFLDLFMPEMDGIEVVNKLATVPNRKDLRIHFLTGAEHHNVTAARMIAAARSLNIGETIYKPVTTRELETILSQEADLIDQRTANS